MAGNLKIRALGNWSLGITAVLAILCIAMSILGFRKYEVLQSSTRDYIACEAAAQRFQTGSDTLTRQVRLAAATGEQAYIDAYFEEANVTRSRETALADLSALHGGEDAVTSLEQALSASMDLMQTEYYAMRLVEEAIRTPAAQWPRELSAVALSPEDAALSGSDKMDRAQELLISPEYEDAKSEIAGDVDAALAVFTDTLTARQQRAADVFARIFRTITVCVVLFAAVMLLECMVIRRGIVRPLLEYNESIRRGIVRPLLEYNESIRHGVIAPIHGVAELRTLAETYNSIYEENEAREILMKHQAEHDSLTELLNRRSFDQLLSLYEKDRSSFALILADVDVFKQINDTCGHDMGDRILKRVAALLHTTFRSIDYVCRIGGDEFAVIMVDMSRELYYTIPDKIAEINGLLAVPEDGLPAVSLSAGVAFSDENDFRGSLFRAADSALYTAKAHGRCGCSVSPAPDETGSKS